jgi:hypothetical protein
MRFSRLPAAGRAFNPLTPLKPQNDGFFSSS